MTVRILDSAINDIGLGREFYKEQSDSAGDYFAQNAFDECESLAPAAGHHKIIRGFFAKLMQNFPYTIFYRITAGEIMIYRILDNRRDPKRNRQALTKPRRSRLGL